MKEILDILPLRVRKGAEASGVSGITDIRMKVNSPLIFMGEKNDFYIGPNGRVTEKEGFVLEKEELENTLSIATGNSLYSYMEDIREGFITLKGGHRMGICGRGVYEKERLLTLKDILFINIRVAREIKGGGERILPFIKNGDRILNTLIISPPGEGKTTLLRELARVTGNIPNMRVSVIDSRFEIGAQYKGIPSLDIGKRSFLLSGYSKKDGFYHGIRCLSSKVIIADELKGEEDFSAAEYGVGCGVSVIASAHGGGPDVPCRDLFERFILIKNRGRDIKIFGREKERIF